MSKSRLVSHILPEQVKYVKYDRNGNTSIAKGTEYLTQLHSKISQSPQMEKQVKYCYRKVHFDSKKEVFKPVDWKYDILRMGKEDDKIIMKRLIRLYEKNYRPSFFPQKQTKQNFSQNQYDQKTPKFLFEFNLLSLSNIKSFFLNQDYTQDGLYQIIINQDGRFRTIFVDDEVPVFQNTDEHIWDIRQPWKMILVKAWALINKGYLGVFQNPTFRFIQYFSNSNWKYFNLQRQCQSFISHYNNKTNFAQIILQTKNSQEVRRIGLIPDFCCYKVKNFLPVVIVGKKQTEYDIQIESFYKHRWQGQLSVASQRIGERQFKNRGHAFKLQGNFYATQNQFKNIFNCAYLTSTRDKNQYISDYYKLTFQKKSKRAIFLTFNIKRKGFLDFSLIQSYENKKKMNSKSFIRAKQYKRQINKQTNSDQRYLKCKYMLIKDNCKDNQMRLQSNQSRMRLQSSRMKPQQNESRTRLQQKQSKLNKQFFKYQLFQIQYLKGYNKGEACFLNIEPGKYYLRIKSQYLQKDAIYYLNYSCHEAINIQEQLLSDNMRKQIFNQAIVSMSMHSPSLSQGRQIVYLGNHFESIGYGYIVIKCKNRNLNQDLLVQIDPLKFKQSGYQFKQKTYKQTQNKFSILVHEGESVAIVIKKIQDHPGYVWPPQGFQIFKNEKRVFNNYSKLGIKLNHQYKEVVDQLNFEKKNLANRLFIFIVI